jgi:hypothetical protein
VNGVLSILDSFQSIRFAIQEKKGDVSSISAFWPEKGFEKSQIQ